VVFFPQVSTRILYVPFPKPRTCVYQRSPQRMAVSVQDVVLLVMTPCSLVGRHRHVLHLLNVCCYNGLFAYGDIEYTCYFCGVCRVCVCTIPKFLLPIRDSSTDAVFDAQPRRM